MYAPYEKMTINCLWTLTLSFFHKAYFFGLCYGTFSVETFQTILYGIIEELLSAEGAWAEPHTLENFVTHRSKKFWLSYDGA